MSQTTPAPSPVKAAPTFLEALALWANALGDDPDPTTAWLGRQVGLMYDRAAYLGATGPEEYEDRDAAARGC